MDSATAKRIIIGSVVLSGALAALTPVSEGETPDVKIAVGMVMLLVFLLAIAEVEPTIAASLGLLVFVSSLTAAGTKPWQLITKAAGQTPGTYVKQTSKQSTVFDR